MEPLKLIMCISLISCYAMEKGEIEIYCPTAADDAKEKLQNSIAEFSKCLSKKAQALRDKVPQAIMDNSTRDQAAGQLKNYLSGRRAADDRAQDWDLPISFPIKKDRQNSSILFNIALCQAGSREALELKNAEDFSLDELKYRFELLRKGFGPLLGNQY